jgi:Tol biopolymer transport system component
MQAGTARTLVVPLIASGTEGGGKIKAGAHTPAWSPDGQWIAFGLDQDATLPLTFPTRLYRVHPDGTGLAPLTNNARGTAVSPVWSNDGNLYYSLNNDMIRSNGIYRFQIATNTHTLLIQGSDLQPISLSPDGKFLLYQQGDGLYLWDFFLQETVEVVPKQDGQQVQFVGWLDGRD